MAIIMHTRPGSYHVAFPQFRKILHCFNEGKKSVGLPLFYPTVITMEINYGGTLFFPILMKERKSGEYTVFPLLNKGKDEWGYTVFPLTNEGEEE